MDELALLYASLEDAQHDKIKLKFDIKGIRHKLGVKRTPAKSDNNPKSKQQDPELYDTLVKLEQEYINVLDDIRDIQDRIYELEDSWYYED